VADDEPAHSKRTALQDGPPRWGRLIVYAFAWLPVFFLLIGIVPRFDSIFQKLIDKGQLPHLTGWLLALVHLDTDCFHLPVALVAITILAGDEAGVRVLRRRENGVTWTWRWMITLGLVGLVAAFIIVLALLLPVVNLTESLAQ
jgi:type II secretory pathway component PulF